VIDPTHPTTPEDRYVLRAAPPVRPLAIAAGAVVLGALLLVLGRAAGVPVVLGVLGGLVMLAGVALAVAALVLAARLRTEVVLDDDGVAVTRLGARRSLPWREVQEVTVAHPRLTLVTAEPAQELSLVNPRRAGDERFLALLARLQQRLDADRGYH
jgi:hypothetical protein